MLKKTTLPRLSPGQWARVRVPDYECWQKSGEYHGPLVGKEVDVCVIPVLRAAVRQREPVPLELPRRLPSSRRLGVVELLRPERQYARAVELRPDRRQH